MNIKAFYHGSDHDGKCSASICKDVFVSSVLIPINHGRYRDYIDLIDKDDTVFMMDICFDKSTIEYLLNRGNKVIVIDHHVSTLKDVGDIRNDLFKLIFSTKYSACELSWKVFNRVDIPKSVKYLGRYDVWDLTDDIIKFEYALQSYDTDPRSNMILWKTLFKSTDIFMNKMIDSGSVIKKYYDNTSKKFIERYAIKTNLDGYRSLAVNSGIGDSRIFDSVYNIDQYDIMIKFCRLPNDRWSVTLYSYNKVDVSKLAEKYGGGGHPNASGFSCKELPFKF